MVKASIAGTVSVRDNMDASEGMFFSGMTLPPYRVGDSVFSGRPVIDVFDPSSMEIKATVNEQERVNVSARQPALVTSNAVPGESFKSIVTAVAGLGRPDRNAGRSVSSKSRSSSNGPMPVCKPGTSVQVVVQGKSVENALQLPRQAVFDKDGNRSCVRGTGPTRFRRREIKCFTALKVGWRSNGLAGNRGGSCRSERGVKTKPSPPRSAQDLEFRIDRRLACSPAAAGLPAGNRPGIRQPARAQAASVPTMLGMIFGVAAVIAMMSIGAGAQQQVIAFIEQYGA